MLCFLSRLSRLRHLHSFPTRRSSDLRCRLAGALEHDIAIADGVVNATQVGMRGFPGCPVPVAALKAAHWAADVIYTDRKSTRLNSSHVAISYAVFCLINKHALPSPFV